MSKWPRISLKSRWGRLILVPPSAEDDTEAGALRSDPVALKYLSFLPQSMTTEQWKEKREANDKNDEVWNFNVHLTSGSMSPGPPASEKSRFIGFCGVFNIDSTNRHGEIGVMLSSHLHRTGLGTEAIFLILSHVFEHPELKLHRVELVTGANNVQMRGWFENFGVGVEFKQREAWKDGKGGWIDAVGYSILEHEWPGLKMRLEKWLNERLTQRVDE